MVMNKLSYFVSPLLYKY
jgi:hypothetical protein